MRSLRRQAAFMASCEQGALLAISPSWRQSRHGTKSFIKLSGFAKDSAIMRTPHGVGHLHDEMARRLTECDITLLRKADTGLNFVVHRNMRQPRETPA